MNEKLPYYMAYPLPLSFDDERKDRRDFEYMKSMYPSLVKRLVPYVEEECDRMDYKCSMIYDEYPDKLQLMMMQRRIRERVKKEEKEEDGKLLNDLIAVLIYQEIYRRRKEERCMRRKFY